MKQNHKIKINDNQIIDIYKQNYTLHEAASKLNVTVITLWRRAKKLNLAWKEKNYRGTNNGSKIPIQEILDGKHPDYQTFKLKNRLIQDNIKINKCEVCGIIDWNTKPLTMQLDHIDGNPHNHKLDNLRMICPNCHGQTETWCGKNK
jgi:hypothetical protein